jgi:ribosomal protein L13
LAAVFQVRAGLSRLNPDGTTDTSFKPNVAGGVFSIVVQADGKILVGGGFTSIGGQPRNNIARLDATTGLADSFDPNANNLVVSLAVQMDGKILAGGRFTSIGGQTRNLIARLDATTGAADSFDPNADSAVSAIVVQADGKMLVGGSFGTSEARHDTISPGSIQRPEQLIRSTRTRLAMSILLRCSPTARF